MSGPQPIRSVEPLISRAQLADLLGVSEDTIDAMRKAGMPSIRWGRRLIRFRASEALTWFEGHGGEAAA
jgi:predicted DNA-binding transcriptional regulator AlpA